MTKPGSEAIVANRSEPRRRQRPAALDFGALDGLLGVHLRLANVAVYSDFLDAMKPLDITQRQSAVLMLIGANLGVTQIALAEFLGINRATMMSMVDRLESRNLVERRAVNGDKRLRGLYLTHEGEATLAAARKRISLHERKLFNCFSPAELKQLALYLGRIHRKF